MADRPFIPVDKVVKVEMRYVMNGNRMENVFHIRKTGLGVVTAADLLGLSDVVRSAWLARFKVLQPTALQLSSIYLRDLTKLETVDYSYSIGLTGDNAGLPLPANATMCIGLKSGLTGRSARGRSFFVGLRQAQATGDFVNTGVATSILAAMTGFAQDINSSGGWEFGTVSYMTNKVWRLAGVFYRTKTLSLADFVVDSMRPRLTGRGA